MAPTPTYDELKERLAHLETKVATLRASEEKYRTLFETMGIATWRCCATPMAGAWIKRYLEMNPALERILGISARLPFSLSLRDLQLSLPD